MDFLFKTTFRALKHRNYRLFFFGQLISLTGTWMQQTALSWLIYKLTGSAFLLGLVTALGTAPTALSTMWGGSLADRYSKRGILIITQISLMASAFVLAGLVWMGWVNIWWIIFLAVFNSLVMGFDAPARHSFVIEMTNKEDLINAISLNSAIFNVTRILGPMAAGILMAHVSMVLCFFFNGVSFLAAITGLSMMRLPALKIIVQEGSAWHQIKESFHYILNQSRLLILCSLFAVVGIFGWSYIVIMPVIAKEILHVGEKGFGMLVSSSGIGALLGALTVATIGHSADARRLTLGGVWITAVSLVVLSISKNFYLSLIALPIIGFGNMLFFSTASTVIQTIIPDRMRGRLMGFWILIFAVSTPLGGLEIGSVSSWISAPVALGSSGFICAMAAITAGLLIKNLNLPKQQPAEIQSDLLL